VATLDLAGLFQLTQSRPDSPVELERQRTHGEHGDDGEEDGNEGSSHGSLTGEAGLDRTVERLRRVRSNLGVDR
jgi:hypothetical protein